MKITRLVKWGGSGNDGCPSVYTTEDPDMLLVQGNILDGDTRANLVQVRDGEDAVLVPRETVLRAAKMLGD